MNTLLDPLAEPLNCPHGLSFIGLPDGAIEWLTIPCRACEPNTVAVSGKVVAA
jgi:hypothetical protein